MSPRLWWANVPYFMKIFQAVTDLGSITRARLNFRRRLILFTPLNRPIQASSFGGKFDQLVFCIFMEFSHKMTRSFLRHDAKDKNKQKPKSRVGPALTLATLDKLKKKTSWTSYFVIRIFYFGTDYRTRLQSQVDIRYVNKSLWCFATPPTSRAVWSPGKAALCLFFARPRCQIFFFFFFVDSERISQVLSQTSLP